MLNWVDGFESYSNLVSWLQYRYASFVGPSATFVPGRAIGNALNFNGTSFATPLFTSQTGWTVGFAFQNVNLGASNIQMPLLQFLDTATAQVYLSFNPSTGIFSLYSGATLLGTGTFAITTGYWYYIEVSVVINSSTGTATSKVNTVTDVSFTGNTQVSSNASANAIAWRGPAAVGLGGAYQIDDIYINDNTTGQNNTFLGDMKVEPVRVIDSGSSTEWGVNVPGTPNFEAVQILNDGLYISSNTPGNLDLYECSSLNFITSDIAGVQTLFWTRNTDSTVHSIQSAVNAISTTYLGSAINITNTAFKAYQTIWPYDPSTSAPWSVSGVGAAEYGVNLNS